MPTIMRTMAAPHQQAPAPGARHLVLYDGVCGLCNRLTRFLLPRDPAAQFAYASLQSDTARSLLSRFGETTEELSTFYVVADFRSDTPQLLARSRAALFVMKTLGGMWRWAGLMLNVLPAKLLDLAYGAIARNRYRLFGRYDSCLAPTPEYRQRFLDV